MVAGDPRGQVTSLYARVAYARHVRLPSAEHLVSLLARSNPWLALHSGQVAHYSSLIAAMAGLSTSQIHSLLIAAQLHDVGKLIERRSAQRDEHPILGEFLCLAAGFSQEITSAVRHHHEWFDGRGFPDGLAGEKIPILARIVSVADTYAHLVVQPSLLAPQPFVQRLARLNRLRGRKLDPDILDLWLTRCSGVQP